MSNFRRDDSPPKSGPMLKIFRLKSNKGGTFGVFGSRIHGFWTHWSGRCSEPCTDPVSECIGHKQEWSLRWKGYLHVYFSERSEEGFLELTPIAADDLLLQVGGESELRGSRITVQRGGGDKSRLKVGIMPRWKSYTGTDVPPEKDPEETLKKLWEFGAKKNQRSTSTKETV